MRLDEELDLIPAHGFLTQIRSLFFGSLASIRNSPALTVLLMGIGFFAGYFTLHYQVVHSPQPGGGTVVLYKQGTIANISGITRTPNSEVVQVNYNKIVPETLQGSLDDPQIRELLTMGTMGTMGATVPTSTGVKERIVDMLADECKAGHRCQAESDGKGIQGALLVALRYDKDPTVRLKALEGLKPYVQQKRVRDVILDCLLHDPNASVRAASVDVLPPVQADSSVRQVLRTVSTQDQNPYIRTASYNVLQSSGDIQ
jgi:hypothetical protein